MVADSASPIFTAPGVANWAEAQLPAGRLMVEVNATTLSSV
jgi:hypothetical protein